MKSSVFKQVVPVDWEFPEEAAVLCLSFAGPSGQGADHTGWLEQLTPDVSPPRRRMALEAVQRFFKKGYGAALTRWVLEDRAPRWSWRRRQHVLQVLTDWAVACGAPPEQLRVLFHLEQLGQRRRREAGRYGDRPPR
ncbi:hypothetical protein [Rhodothermus marinus]|uniref:Uncharacterized protein n=1 Tax=Rhodothermus marinus (strain ATCC 43812 / DSM 4252 / R-10) TaxID=518766 RepID=D0MJV7_RHOM4|nr:hypothetical protein [Rhodothermus marinus]ACY48765.1 hypothetical protein Rmar_1882 [Rhodothermus marinus DSM 4252]